MPGLIAHDDSGRKRKRIDDVPNVNGVKSRKAPKTTTYGDDTQSRIVELEQQILGSREHYNNIVELQSLLATAEKKPKTATLAAVSLCRVFCRLIAGEELVKQKKVTEAEIQILHWLKARLRDYVDSVLAWIGSPDATQESTALTLLMRIVKEEVSQGAKRSEQAWRTEKSTFCLLVSFLLGKNNAESARQEFVERFVEEHDDVRFHTFLAVKQYFASSVEVQQEEDVIGNAINLFSGIEGVPESEDQLEDWYGEPPIEGHQVRSLHTQRKIAQEAWLAVFRSALTRDHRKAILAITTSQVLPWFATRIELLTDFLTDSFNEGGSLALLALSGIFHLMTQKNLDYPDFYTKLYSLLNQDILHSKYRSRFFRLFDTFMSSSHLPAAMVASFIKRLSRLALHAPPGAIVWIVPWTYNTLKQHPACTFMLHRPYHPAHAIYHRHTDYKDSGMDDPFDMRQPDPMHTHAIDSSLWELETLQAHYHPNVATLARILSEQFTKREYQLEDFLDHSYQGLIEAELGKELKKAPVVEWEIPKRIVTGEDGGLNGLGVLLQAAVGIA